MQGCSVASHVSAERLPRGEHGATGAAPVHVAGRACSGALARARAEEKVQAVRAHQGPLVARPVASQRLERRERAPARLAPVLLLADAAVVLLRDHLARRRQRQRQDQSP